MIRSSQYKCTYPGCNKSELSRTVTIRVFNWKSNLNVHMRTHEVNRPRNFVCTEPNCGKRFYDQQHLKQHMQIHKRTPNVSVAPRGVTRSRTCARSPAAPRSTRRLEA